MNAAGVVMLSSAKRSTTVPVYYRAQNRFSTDAGLTKINHLNCLARFQDRDAKKIFVERRSLREGLL